MEYQARRLPRNREYAGYQFYAALSYKDKTAEECFLFAVLTIVDWLKERLSLTESIPKELSALPDRSHFTEAGMDQLEPCRISSGFTADISAVPSEYLWALRLKEPDSDTEKRKAVPGRFFTTNIGIARAGDRVEFGVRIDVTDPEGAEEISFAFRPKFIRWLYSEEALEMTQVIPLTFGAVPVENADDFRTLRTLLDDSQRQMPAVIMTQAVRKPEVKNGFPGPNGGMPPFSAIGTPSAPPFAVPGAGTEDPLAAMKKMVEAAKAAAARQTSSDPGFFPYDADGFASHSFGYAAVFAVTEEMHDALAKKIHKEYRPGDILIAEPKRFGGNVRVYSGADAEQKAQDRAHEYSKHRNYNFGDVLFEFDLRQKQQKAQLEAIRASTKLAAEEKINRLNQMIEDLQGERDAQVAKISLLKEQNEEEFERGMEAERLSMQQFYDEHDLLEKQVHQLQANNERLERENEEMRALSGAVENLRSMAEMPQTNDDVVNYFQTVFEDRIAFTDRGLKSAHRCEIRPGALWYYLYFMATDLIDIYRSGNPDTEGAFMAATGIEMARGEGKQSHKDNSIMRTRMDTYRGKEICIEPHVKLNDNRAGAGYQRIYYCYDGEMDRIIIGWVGEHLKTYGTQFAG